MEFKKQKDYHDVLALLEKFSMGYSIEPNTTNKQYPFKTVVQKSTFDFIKVYSALTKKEIEGLKNIILKGKKRKVAQICIYHEGDGKYSVMDSRLRYAYSKGHKSQSVAKMALMKYRKKMFSSTSFVYSFEKLKNTRTKFNIENVFVYAKKMN